MSRAPSGRAELLYWINSCSGLQNPSVESLRDAAAYNLVMEACLQRAVLQSKNTNESNVVEQRATLASKLLQRVDWDANAATGRLSASREVQDPSQDSIQLRDACEKNFQVLQEVLRRCVPKDHTLEIDVKRLALGKLQEHIRLLQWMHAFTVKMAKAFPEVSTEQAPLPSKSSRSRSADAKSTSKQTKSAMNSTAVRDDYQAERYREISMQQAPRAQLEPQEETRHVDGRLSKLVAQVEALEMEAATASTDDSKMSDNDVSITDLKALLEERDILWQTLTLIEQLVESENDRSKLPNNVHMSQTPLFRELAAIYHIKA